MSARLPLAIETGGLCLPETGVLSVLHPVAGYDLSSLPRHRVQVIQPFKPDFDYFRALGHDCQPDTDTTCAAAVVCLPRTKALARALIADAARRSTGPVIVDGTKTDGIDSILKEVRKRVSVQGPLSKAHGKIFWFQSGPDSFSDWQPSAQTVDGFVTAPGVFSADGIDPASRLLSQSMPNRPGKHVVDLGAGWGYLSARLLADPTIERIDLVEADARALDCARQNVTDARAVFHWADATVWTPEDRVDAVVMNPPFHVGRAANPDLGRAFVTSAARMLASSGQLWMVANRHLPYERTLSDSFIRVEEVGGDSQFKILRAARPRSQAKPAPLRTRR